MKRKEIIVIDDEPVEKCAKTEEVLNYHTDGSCTPNPGPAGFSIILNMKPVVLGSEPYSTNIRMEGCAIISAMTHAQKRKCTIYTDSKFWVDVVYSWAANWEKNNWKKPKGEIKNLDLVKKIYFLHKQSNAQLVWVKGHAANEGNILADKWANIARDNITIPLL
jgi:ribonuclease HI